MKEKYACAVCGKTYDSVEERSLCEAKCLKEAKVNREVKAKAEAEKAKKDLLSEIKNSIAATDELIEKYRETFKTEPPVTRCYKKEFDFDFDLPRSFLSWLLE